MSRKSTFSLIAIAMITIMTLISINSVAESKRHYENRFKIMLDVATRLNDYVRRHLEDKNLTSYAQTVAEVNVLAAEQMTPPSRYAMLHPHFLLVLENIERSFYYAANGKMSRYRHHQKMIRKELHMLEILAERVNLELFLYSD